MRAYRICGIADEAASGLDDQLALHASLGLVGVELRTVGGKLLHELDDAAFAAVVAAVDRSGLLVTVVDTPIGGWATSLATPFDDELALLRRYADRARALGCSRLRIMSYPSDGRPEADWRRESLRRVAVLVEAARIADVVLLHENCHGWASRDAQSTVDMLRTIDDDHLRLIFDAGNGLAYGYDGYDFLSQVRPWVDHVHVKDAVVVDGVPRWVAPGEGQARLRESLHALFDGGYAGWLSLEPHLALVPHEGLALDDAQRAEGYRRCVEALRGLLTELGR